MPQKKANIIIVVDTIIICNKNKLQLLINFSLFRICPNLSGDFFQKYARVNVENVIINCLFDDAAIITQIYEIVKSTEISTVVASKTVLVLV